MALLTCSECGGQVSSTASACPHCGAPVSAAPAVEERKCEDCGAILPEGAAACPTCGCPTGIAAAKPAPAPRPAYIAPTVAPARAQLGSAEARITEQVNGKIASANVWFFIVSAAAIVMYLVAFVKYMKVLNKLLDYAGSLIGKVVTSAGDEIAKGKATELLDTCKLVRFLLIAALVIAGIAFIFDMVRISQKKLMSNFGYGIPALLIAGFWIPSGYMSKITGFDSNQIQGVLDLITKDDFGTFINVAPWIIVVLLIISGLVAASIPKVTDFCSHCGRYIRNEGAGGVCKGCGQRKYIPGFTPIPRDVVAAYPYSGETLVGMSQLDKSRLVFTILGAMLFGGLGIWGLVSSFIMVRDGSHADVLVIPFFFLFAFLTPTIIFLVRNFRNGLRSKITVTPTSISLINAQNRNRLNASVSEITDVLTNESGDLAICSRGIAYIFTDISGRAQIAAALDTLTSKNQMS